MQFKIAVFSTVLIPFLMIGCSKKNSESAESVTTKTLTRNPILFEKEIDSCLSIFAMDEDINVSIFQFIDDKPNYNLFNFKDQIVDNYVESPMTMPISKTIYGIETSYKMEFFYNETEEKYYYYSNKFTNKDVTSNYGDKLDICPGTSRYGKLSFENAGLNVSKNITATYKALIEADPELVLEPIKLNIGPIKKRDMTISGGPQDGQNEFLYETDNASYSPKNKEISFLPQSKEFREYIGSVGYWETPMVAAHEYGHHVFTSLINQTIEQSGDDAKICFQNILNHKNQFNSTTSLGSDRVNTSVFGLAAISEGFADLVSFYSLKESQGSVKGINCFEGMRDINIKKFGKNANKVFNKESLETLNTESRILPDLDCTTPDFQEVHDVGAVFAYSVNSLLSKVNDNKKVKLKIILNWVRELDGLFKKVEHLEAGEFLFNAIELAYKEALNQSDIEVTSEHCKGMNKVFTDDHGYECMFLK